jgi:hypothetical protein
VGLNQHRSRSDGNGDIVDSGSKEDDIGNTSEMKEDDIDNFIDADGSEPKAKEDICSWKEL